MKPREARVEFRRDVAARGNRGGSATVAVLDEPLLAHPWHVPTREEIALAAEARFRRLPTGESRDAGWSDLSDDQRAVYASVAEMHAIDVVGPTAVRVLEQAAQRADVEGCPKVAAWLRSLLREVEV